MAGELSLRERVLSSPVRRIHMLAWRDLDDPEAGGSEIHAHAIASRWAEAGLRVTMRTSYAAGRAQDIERADYRVVRKAGRYLVFPRAIASEVAGRMGPSDGLVEIWNGMPFFSPLWYRGPRIVLLHHVHAEMWRMVLPPKLARLGELVEYRLAPPVYRDTDIVTLSGSSKSDMVEQLGFDPARIHVVNPGIDGRFSPLGGEADVATDVGRSDTPLVAAVGRLVPVKRWDLLITALAQLKQQHPQLRAVIAGEGYEREALQKQRSDLGADDWIELPGRISDDALVDLYRRSWMVASSSVREGWGMTLTEAAACGTPAVATDIPGHRDSVIDGVSGILAASPAGLAAAMDTIISDQATRHALSKGAFEASKAYSWGSAAAEIFSVLNSVSERNDRT